MSRVMEDTTIVQLFWDRNEQGLQVASNKYGHLCTSIALNILGNQEDAEECVNDTFLAAWNSIPPQRPAILAPFLGKIASNLAINRYKHNRADKRGGGNTPVVIEELSEVIPGGISPENELLSKEMLSIISRFLSTLSPDKRKLFVRRYWYADSVSAIATATGLTENNINVTLSRLRKQLHQLLVEGGIDV